MCPEEGGAAGLGELRSWWEVPAIAHFCSLFRTAFRLPDFEIEVRSRRCALSPRFSAGSRWPPTWRGVRAARGARGGHEAGGRLGLPVAPRALAGGGRACFCRRGIRGLSRDFSAGLRARVRARSPAGASEAASSCSGGDRDGMRAHAPGATAAGPERPRAGAALLGRRSPGSHLADLRRPVTLRRFESTSGGRRWGLGLGRSPCGTARRSPSLGTPRLWRESLRSPLPFKTAPLRRKVQPSVFREFSPS